MKSIISDILWFTFGGQTVKSFLWFMLGFVSIFAPAFAYCETVNQIYYDPVTSCVVGWNISGNVITHPDYVDIGMPEFIRVETVSLSTTSTIIDIISRPCVISY